jgi:uncharacterized SAM-binding protein YcdF (DUF218 family)
MYALISELLNPLLLIMVVMGLAVVGLWRNGPNGRRSLWILTASLALLWFVCTPLAAHLSLSTLETGYPPLERRPRDVQAIVVLGGSVRAPNSLRPWTELRRDSLRRCVEAERLYRQGEPLPVIVSGGKVDTSRPGPTLAAAMAQFLRNDGVQQVVEEGASRSTYENAVETALILNRREVDKCLLVTDCTHMKRALACFQAQGIDCIPAAAHCSTEQFDVEVTTFLPYAAAAESQRIVLHEWVGMLWYWLCGRI